MSSIVLLCMHFLCMKLKLIDLIVLSAGIIKFWNDHYHIRYSLFYAILSNNIYVCLFFVLFPHG